MSASDTDIARLLDDALAGCSLAAAEVERLLAIDDPTAAEPLFAAASELRRRHFGDRVFLYGFVYFSTFCRNSCTFCLYRRGNVASPRYRKAPGEVVEACRELAASGVHLLDLTMGEDPHTHVTGNFSPVVELVRLVRAATGLPIMTSPGVVPATALTQLRRAGADWYACYQETHNRTLYNNLRVGQTYGGRVAARARARMLGLLVEDGILLGVGESTGDVTHSLLTMRDEGVEQARVMSLVPQEGTPLAGASPPPALRELVAIAVMRLLMPDRLIPASLDVEGIAGLLPRLRAGANVVTSLVPSTAGLCGVSNAELDIVAGLRSVAGVTARLPAVGLRAATLDEYRGWLAYRRQARATVETTA